MWWTVDPDGFWGKGNADAVEVSLTSHLPTVSGANTGRLLSRSLLPQTHLPPPFSAPFDRRVSMLPLLQGQVGFRKNQ